MREHRGRPSRHASSRNKSRGDLSSQSRTHLDQPGFSHCTFSPARAALRDLARSGIAVASSIHAPSPDTFALFDRVLILQRGRAVYFGENGGEGWGAVYFARAWQGAWRGLCDTYHARRSACSAHVSQPLRTHCTTRRHCRAAAYPPCGTGEACRRFFAEQFPALRPMRPWEGVADYMCAPRIVLCGPARTVSETSCWGPCNDAPA